MGIPNDVLILMPSDKDIVNAVAQGTRKGLRQFTFRALAANLALFAGIYVCSKLRKDRKSDNVDEVTEDEVEEENNSEEE